MLAYILVGATAFTLGIFVTLFCLECNNTQDSEK